MKLVFACVAALALAAGCTDQPAVDAETQSLGFEWRCVNLCPAERPCQALCVVEEKKEALILTPAVTCPAIHQLNQCGDACCDELEMVRYGQFACPADCGVPEDIEVDRGEYDTFPVIRRGGEALGEWRDGAVHLEHVLANSCE